MALSPRSLVQRWRGPHVPAGAAWCGGLSLGPGVNLWFWALGHASLQPPNGVPDGTGLEISGKLPRAPVCKVFTTVPDPV